MARDYYDILGVPGTATEAEIRQAFRLKARQLHPDVNKQAGATEQFQQLNEAYQVLSDPDRRAHYDRVSAARRARARAASKPAYTPPASARPNYKPTGPDPRQSPGYPSGQPAYQYSWQRPRAEKTPAWVSQFAGVMRHFVGSGFFWAFIIIQIVSIIALPTGAPLLGTGGWTIVWLGSFVLPVIAIVIGVSRVRARPAGRSGSQPPH